MISYKLFTIIRGKRTIIFLIKVAVVFIFSFFWISSKNTKEILNDWFLLLVLLTIIYFLVNNYIKSLAYPIRVSDLITKNIYFKTGSCKANIYHSKTKIRLPMNSREVLVEIPPKKGECDYIKTQNELMLFCRRYYFNKLDCIYYNPISVLLKNEREQNSPTLLDKKIVDLSNLFFNKNDLVVLTNDKMKITRIDLHDFNVKLLSEDDLYYMIRQCESEV